MKIEAFFCDFLEKPFYFQTELLNLSVAHLQVQLILKKKRLYFVLCYESHLSL